MRQQGDHADEARDGEDVYRGRGLFADVDLLVRDVVHDCESLGLVWLVVVWFGEAGGVGRTVAIPIQPGRRSRGSLKPPAKERTPAVM